MDGNGQKVDKSVLDKKLKEFCKSLNIYLIYSTKSESKFRFNVYQFTVTWFK